MQTVKCSPVRLVIAALLADSVFTKLNSETREQYADRLEVLNKENRKAAKRRAVKLKALAADKALIAAQCAGDTKAKIQAIGKFSAGSTEWLVAIQKAYPGYGARS